MTSPEFPGESSQPTSPQPAPVSQPATQQPSYPPTGVATAPPPPPAKPANGLGLTALIVGIGAFVFGWVPVLGFILGGAAIVFGILALVKKQSKGMGITGIVLGVIAVITCLIVTIIFSITAAVVSSAPDAIESAIAEAEETVEEPAAPAETEEPAEPAEPVLETQTFTGSGDFVQPVNVETLAYVTFACPACTSNTVLKTNGAETLLVNTIGTYSGSHFINLSNGSITTQFEINADNAWTLTVGDWTTATTFDGPASGAGDAAIIMPGEASAAALTNDGDRNFAVWVYGDFTDLAVNTIGAYSGTVVFETPALVQVQSNGNWTITPQ